MAELTLLAVLALALGLWFDHRKIQDYAIDYCRRACADAGLQFLDETAALSRLRLRRDAGGSVRFERWFSFEYGAPDGDRGHGYVTLLGRRVTAFVLQARS